MAVRDDFAAGEVLAAADLNDTFGSKVDYATPTNAQTGTAYTFVADDAERITTASNGSAVTFTIPPQSSVGWGDDTILRVVNYGAGALTVAGGSGVTVTNTATTLAQYESAAAIRTGSDAWTLVPFAGGGAGDADFSNSATGTYTDSGVDYKYVTFTSSGTLTVTQEGYADVLVVAGGGGGADYSSAGIDNESGGGAGGVSYGQVLLEATTYTVTIGGGGNGITSSSGINTTNHGAASSLGSLVTIGGGGGAGAGPGTVRSGHSGGGASGGVAAAAASGTFRANGGSAASVRTNSITGSSVTYSTGGLGSSTSAGSANSGDGGGRGANGGSGVVIVRVRTS